MEVVSLSLEFGRGVDLVSHDTSDGLKRGYFYYHLYERLRDFHINNGGLSFLRENVLVKSFYTIVPKRTLS